MEQWMPDSPTALTASQATDGSDRLALRWWFLVHAVWLLACTAALVVLLRGADLSWERWSTHPQDAFGDITPAAKLVACAMYLSVCCTFLPLPTGWIIAALATREASVAGSLWGVVLLVATSGAIGSTIANLGDYHLMTWMLRHRRVAAVRSTRLYERCSRWFASAPFTILVIANVLPIPIDVVRILAVANRYPRGSFAGANFLGRFARYGIVAFITYFWDLGWGACVALLVLAAGLALARIVPVAIGRAFPKRP
jgi:membrane protein YqaA with SNARE-associated domain